MSDFLIVLRASKAEFIGIRTLWLHLRFISDALELLVQRPAAPIRPPERLGGVGSVSA